MNCNNKHKIEKHLQQRLGVVLIAMALLCAACGSQASVIEEGTTPTAATRGTPTPTSPAPFKVVPGDWSTYLSDNGRSGYNKDETTITATTAAELKLHWMYHAKNYISTQPMEAFGMIYWGSWDGLEHATDLNGHEVWATSLGRTHKCGSIIGVAGTGTAAVVSIGGKKTPVIFVGGGNAHFYALNAASGAIIWNTPLGTPPDHFIWSSPIVYKGSVYVGMASFGDCPTIQGKLFQMSMVTGAIKHTFDVVPKGCQGGAVWGSPTIDDGTGELYIATGNADPCSTTEIYTSAVVELHASDLKVVGLWRVPPSQWVIDPDFGSTPTLFKAKIGGVSRAMVGVAHKNGIYYAFLRGDLSRGPLWTAEVAKGGSCPNCGTGSISPSAWDGTQLYVAGGYTTVQGVNCRSGLRALNPATGAFIWERCLSDGPILAAVTVVPGVVAVTGGSALLLVDATSGETLFIFHDTNRGSVFYGAASISHGMLYAANFDGRLYAFGL
jgi:polyvinyl alcohol dehydrogenase (cytochrome)